MSSILDALRKVEEEKQAALQGAGADFNGDTAERELLGAPARGSGVLISPRVLVAGAVIFTALVAGLSAAVSLSLQRVNSSQTAALDPAQPAPAQPSTAPMDPITADPTSQSPPSVSDTSGQPLQSAPDTSAPTPNAMAAIPDSQVNTAPPIFDTAPIAPPRPSAAELAEMRAEAVRLRREREAREREAAAARMNQAAVTSEGPLSSNPRPVRRDIEPVNVRSLPVMSPLEKERYGLGRVQINMVSVATDRRPIPSAVINLKAIHIGELIPGTSARLIGVDNSGVGIELESTGRRYLLPF